MSQINKTGRRTRRVSAVAALLMVGTTMPSMAFDPKVHAEIRYQIDCAILMLTDPVAHVETCNPQPITGLPTSIADTNSTGAPPPAPPAPPAPVAEEEEEEDPCPGGYPDGCGGCYYEET